MRGQRKIRGVGGDNVWLTIAPDPLDESKRPMLHVAIVDVASDGVASTEGVAMLSMAGARRMHAALGALLMDYDRC